MKQAFLVFRKDVQHLWRELGVYVLLLTVYAVAAPQVWPDKTPNSFLAMFVTLLKVLMPASWLVLITRAVHEDRLVGDEQFWITRPYRWTSLLGAKLLFVTVCVAMPFVLMQWVVLLEAGLSPFAAKSALLISLLRFALNPMLTFFVVACVTKGLAQAFSFLVGIIVAWAGLLTFILSGSEMRMSPPHEWALFSVLFGGLMIGIVIYQYARRRTIQSRMAIGGTLALFLLLMIGLDRAGFGAPVKAFIRHHYAAAGSLRLALAASVPYEERGSDMRIPGGMVELKLPVRVEGLTDDAKLRMPYIAVEMDADGMHYAPAWQDAVLSEHAVGFLMPKDMFSRYAAADTKMHLELVAEELRPVREVKSVVTDRFQGPMHGVCLLIDRKVYCRYPYEEVASTRVETSPCGGGATSQTLRYMPVGGRFDQVVNEMLPVPGNSCAGDLIRFTEYKTVREFRVALDVPSIRIGQYRAK